MKGPGHTGKKGFSRRPVTRSADVSCAKSPRGLVRSHRLKGRPRKSRIVAVAIAGGSGAGKSWLARRLKRRLGGFAGVISLDDFYRDLSHLPSRERDDVNFDRPQALDWRLYSECLERLLRGEEVDLPRYDFRTHTRFKRPRRWRPRRVVLIEGLWPWQQPGAAKLYALKLFLDTPMELRFSRRRDRDVRERGRTTESSERQWHRQSEPMCRRYVIPQKRNADFILSENLPLKTLDRLVDLIREAADLKE